MHLTSISQFLLIIGVLAGMTGCGNQPRQVTVHDFQILREYGWDSTLADPQATWNPQRYQVLARSLGGFVLLEEGSGKQEYFASRSKHDTANPTWINHYQFVFGPKENVVTVGDGRVVPTNEGLFVVTIQRTISGKNVPEAPKELTKFGYRPRAWGDKIVATSEDRIYVVNSFGDIEEFGPGFLPEPQRNGMGITWQERPVFEKDYWTGSDKIRGSLYIRWEKGRTTTLENAVEARWTHDGGVLATVLRNDPQPNQPWWNAGTDIYYVANADAPPVLVAADARSADPHPSLPVCAAVGATGSIIISSYDGNFRHQIANKGDYPKWSYDGRRLLTEEKVEAKPDVKYMHVYVLKNIDLVAGKK